MQSEYLQSFDKAFHTEFKIVNVQSVKYVLDSKDNEATTYQSLKNK